MTDESVILAFKSGAKFWADGHTIYSVEAYVKAGWPESFVKGLEHTHESDTSDPKTTIFTKSGVAKSLTGVYNLDFLWALAAIVGADTNKASSMMGRGFQAQCLCEALEKRKEAYG